MLASCAGASWVDPSRRSFVAGGTAWIPVREGYGWDEDLPERANPARRGYQRLGDLVLFHGPRPDGAAVRDAVSRCSPRGVLWLRGHAGVERVPEVEVLQGEAGEVVHRENGLVYRLDPSRVMFSGGNREEKARLAGLVRDGERAADLFAGIGYFTLALARAGARVHAMEINPVAFGYLGENLASNGLSGLVEARCGDCRDLLRGVYRPARARAFRGAGLPRRRARPRPAGERAPRPLRRARGRGDSARPSPGRLPRAACRSRPRGGR